jgi:hypothetical protein
LGGVLEEDANSGVVPMYRLVQWFINMNELNNDGPDDAEEVELNFH